MDARTLTRMDAARLAQASAEDYLNAILHGSGWLGRRDCEQADDGTVRVRAWAAAKQARLDLGRWMPARIAADDDQCVTVVPHVWVTSKRGASVKARVLTRSADSVQVVLLDTGRVRRVDAARISAKP